MTVRGRWRKSSYSDSQQECVEVALSSAAIGVRDTKNRQGGELALHPAAWHAFVRTANRAMR